jgi:hypothetical protein
MSDVRVEIEVTGDDVDHVAAQIPRAETLEPGTRVVVASRSKGWLGKVFGARGAFPLPLVGSALLARGYVDIGAGNENGRAAAWGRARSER